jgi:aldose 1-epimerase
MMITPFGTAPGGEPVFLIKLDNGIISCEIITFGATIRSVVVPDHNGNPVDSDVIIVKRNIHVNY